MLPTARQTVYIHSPVGTTGIVELLNFRFHDIEKIIQVQFPVWFDFIFIDRAIADFHAHNAQPTLLRLYIVLR